MFSLHTNFTLLEHQLFKSQTFSQKLRRKYALFLHPTGKPPHHLPQKLHRQTHYIGQAAFDSLDEFIAVLLYRVCPRLVPPRPAGDMLGNLLRRHPPRIYNRRIAFDQFRPVA